MLDTGYRISDLNNIPVLKEECGLKGKIALENTYFLGYAHSVYGINYNKQNYKIPLNSLREDIKGYIGISSINGNWSRQLKLWHGEWENKLQYNKSYVWVWPKSYEKHEHYNPTKFDNLEDSYFIINDAPYPYETGDLNNRDKGELPAKTLSDGTVISINMPLMAEDKYPSSNKLVTKDYIDKRLSSQRLIEVDTKFTVRDYSCTYIIRANTLQKAEAEAIENDKKILIEISCPESFKKLAAHNKIQFTVLLEGVQSGSDWIPAVETEIEWQVKFTDDSTATLSWISDKPASGGNGHYQYGAARYIAINFTSITNEIEYAAMEEIIEGEAIRSNYEILPDVTFNAICENAIYKASGIESINDIKGSKAYIHSNNDSVLVETTSTSKGIEVDLAVNPDVIRGYINISDTVIEGDDYIKETKISKNHWKLALDPSVIKPDISITGDDYIKPTPNGDGNWSLSFDSSKLDLSKFGSSIITPVPSDNIIVLADSYTKTYWSNANNQVLNFNAEGLEQNETISVTLLYKPSVDSVINGDIVWVMCLGDSKPTFKGNRLYNITFTYIPSTEGLVENSIITGRINWFKQF